MDYKTFIKKLWQVEPFCNDNDEVGEGLRALYNATDLTYRYLGLEDFAVEMLKVLRAEAARSAWFYIEERADGHQFEYRLDEIKRNLRENRKFRKIKEARRK